MLHLHVTDVFNFLRFAFLPFLSKKVNIWDFSSCMFPSAFTKQRVVGSLSLHFCVQCYINLGFRQTLLLFFSNSNGRKNYWNNTNTYI